MADPREAGRSAASPAAPAADGTHAARRTTVRQRSWLEIRWRQFRNPPRPVSRAVMSSGTVAIVLGLGYLVYDVAISRGATLPGGDLRSAAVISFVAAVLTSGSVL